MSKHDTDLTLSAYRMAGNLAFCQYQKAGGWFLIWHDQKSDRYPATGKFFHSAGESHLMHLAGFLAEEIGTVDTLEGGGTDLEKCLANALDALKRETGETVSHAESRQVLKVMCSRWFQTRGYALHALKQWDDPTTLQAFSLASIKGEQASIPAHHREAYKTNAVIRASIVQSGDPRYSIPDALRVGPRQTEAPTSKPETNASTKEAR